MLDLLPNPDVCGFLLLGCVGLLMGVTASMYECTQLRERFERREEVILRLDQLLQDKDHEIALFHNCRFYGGEPPPKTQTFLPNPAQGIPPGSYSYLKAAYGSGILETASWRKLSG